MKLLFEYLIITRINCRQRSMGRFDPSTDIVQVPKLSRNYPMDSLTWCAKNLERSKILYSSGFQAVTKPNVRWSIIGNGTGQKVVFELKIPIPKGVSESAVRRLNAFLISGGPESKIPVLKLL